PINVRIRPDGVDTDEDVALQMGFNDLLSVLNTVLLDDALCTLSIGVRGNVNRSISELNPDCIYVRSASKEVVDELSVLMEHPTSASYVLRLCCGLSTRSRTECNP